MSSRSVVNVWLIVALSIFAWFPLLTPAYFFRAHDAQHSIFYVVEFAQALQDGYLWPRWSPDFAFGYGYPLFNIYPPLAIYAASMLYLLGLKITTAVKTIYVLAMIIAGLGMYGFVRRLFGDNAGLLAALVYIYAPFHFVDIFIRSAFAEFVALAIIPFLFWAFTELIVVPTGVKIALAGLAYGGLALTHHSSFFTFTPFLMIYILYLVLHVTHRAVRNDNSAPNTTGSAGRISASAGFLAIGKLLLSRTSYLKQFVRHALPPFAAGLLGAALSAIYLIPALTETKYIKIEQWTSGSYSYLDHFVYFSQLFSPMWGYGYAGIGTFDDFSYQLGILPVILTCFALVTIVGQRLSHSRPHFSNHGTAIFFFVSTIVIILLMSPLAVWVWQVIPLATLVQFPWRLLGVTAFTMAVVSGSLLAQYDSDSQGQAPVYLLLLVVALGSFPYTLPQYTEIPDWAETPLSVINWDRKSIADRVGMVAVTDEQPQTSPMEAQYLNNEPLQVAGIIAGTGQVETLHHGGSSDKVRVMAESPATVQFYTYDFPGWQVSQHGQPLEHRPEPPYGLITVDVPAGTHELYLQMGTTLPRSIGTGISTLACLLIVILFLFPRKSLQVPDINRD
ncbi:hypothetical protein QUF58_06760 [Anaerolineales bacterium HSG24]|nr:hypothetical protein [Anaerolineales bacterium HSG24]